MNESLRKIWKLLIAHLCSLQHMYVWKRITIIMTLCKKCTKWEIQTFIYTFLRVWLHQCEIQDVDSLFSINRLHIVM